MYVGLVSLTGLPPVRVGRRYRVNVKRSPFPSPCQL
jgi:hypothetical protein